MKNRNTDEDMTVEQVALEMVRDRLTSFTVLPYDRYGTVDDDEARAIRQRADKIIERLLRGM